MSDTEFTAYLDRTVNEIIDNFESECETDRERKLVEIIRDMRAADKRYYWCFNMLGAMHLTSAVVMFATSVYLLIKGAF